jgi:hypothetical protein
LKDKPPGHWHTDLGLWQRRWCFRPGHDDGPEDMPQTKVGTSLRAVGFRHKRDKCVFKTISLWGRPDPTAEWGHSGSRDRVASVFLTNEEMNLKWSRSYQ